MAIVLAKISDLQEGNAVQSGDQIEIERSGGSFKANLDTIITKSIHDKGYYATSAALIAAYPTANVGDYAIVGETDTEWLWDDITSAWLDTGDKILLQALLKTQNLNDLPNKATARTNLDIFSKSEINSALDLKDNLINDSKIAGINKKDALNTIYNIFNQYSIDNAVDLSDQGVKVDNGFNAYYPSLLFDGNAFGANDGYNFKCIYSYGSGTALKVIKSKDCITWTAPIDLIGFTTNAHHATWTYDAGGFGTQGSIKYKLWYWNSSVSNLLISTIRYAESADGITWTNDQAITQDATYKLITGVSGAWNSATWGFQKVFYNAKAINTGTNPFDYSYVVYYDANTGTTYQTTGLAYSIDGKNWFNRQTQPVLDRNSGNALAWDFYSASFGSFIKDINGIHCWYSGGQTAGGHTDNFGIGYAHSIDGINFVKDANNPIFTCDDGITYRDERCYTPSIVDDKKGTLKMLYTATGSAQTGRKKLALATLQYNSNQGGGITQPDLDTKANDSAVVHKTTDETITGIKTFSSFPITPSTAPTTDYQAANKKYVDDQLADIPNLDANKITSGVFDIARIPAGAIPVLKIVADEAARFALTTTDVQNGDTVKQTDTNVLYYVKDDTNLSNANGYELYKGSVDWTLLTSKPQNIVDIAAISASNDDIIQKKAGVFINRTPVQLKADLSLTGADVVNVPSGDIAAITIQAAINELDTEKEKLSNKVVAFQGTPDDTHFPSEKLVKDQLDLKINKDINSLTEKTSLSDNDLVVIADSASSYSLKKAKKSNVGGASGTVKAITAVSVIAGGSVVISNAILPLSISSKTTASNITGNIDYNTPADYDLSNSAEVVVTGGVGSLKPTSVPFQTLVKKQQQGNPDARMCSAKIDNDSMYFYGGMHVTPSIGWATILYKYILSTDTYSTIGTVASSGNTMRANSSAVYHDNYLYLYYGYYNLAGDQYPATCIQIHTTTLAVAVISNSLPYVMSTYTTTAVKDTVNNIAYIVGDGNGNKLIMHNLNTHAINTFDYSAYMTGLGRCMMEFHNGALYFGAGAGLYATTTAKKIYKFTPNNPAAPTTGTMSAELGTTANTCNYSVSGVYNNQICAFGNINTTLYKLVFDLTTEQIISEGTTGIASADIGTVGQVGDLLFDSNSLPVPVWTSFTEWSVANLLKLNPANTYSTNTTSYITTTNNSAINLSSSSSIVSIAWTETLNSQSIKYLWSWDDGITWKYYNAGWFTTATPTLPTDAKASSVYTNAAMQALNSLFPLTRLHVRAFPSSNSAPTTPTIGNIQLVTGSVLGNTTMLIPGTDWTYTETNLDLNNLTTSRNITITKSKTGTHDLVLYYQ